MANGQIRITPDQLRAEAKKLKDFNDQHERTFSDMQKLIGNLKSQWEGKAMEAFEGSFNSAKKELDKFKVSIDNFILNMQTSAKTIEDTDRDLATKLGK